MSEEIDQSQVNSIMVEAILEPLRKMERADLSTVLTRVISELELGCVTRWGIFTKEDLICDPVVLIQDDLDSCTMGQWLKADGYERLEEALSSEANEAISMIEQDAVNYEEEEEEVE